MNKIVKTFLETIEGQLPHYRLFEINKRIRDWKNIGGLLLQINELTFEKYRIIKREMLDKDSIYVIDQAPDDFDDYNIQFMFTAKSGEPAITTKLPKRIFFQLEKAYLDGKFKLESDDK